MSLEDLDYRYCNVLDSCIHRRGCKRWLGNYKDKVSNNLVNFKECINEDGESKFPDRFLMPDRFRGSLGGYTKGYI